MSRAVFVRRSKGAQSKGWASGIAGFDFTPRATGIAKRRVPSEPEARGSGGGRHLPKPEDIARLLPWIEWAFAELQK